MTTKKHSKRKAQLTKYLEQLDEFNWHHPTQVSEMADSQHERDNRTYYLAQLSLVLFNNLSTVLYANCSNAEHVFQNSPPFDN